jgi:hypothetical protein
MNRINLQAIAVASIFSAATMIFAQTAAPASAKTDSAAEIKVSNPAEPAVTKEPNDKAVSYNKDHSSFGLPGEKAGNFSPKKGYGIAGGPIPGFIAFDFRPINNLIKASDALNERTFGNLSRTGFEPMVTMGGMGYLGFGNGLRLGGGGADAERNYLSDAFARDSVVSLKVSVGYGGFLVEKAFSVNRFNFLTGTQIGGGEMKVTARRTLRGGNSAFTADQNNNNVATQIAKLFLLEFHGGFTYSIAPILHLGADVMLPMFYSANGFDAYTTGFVTVNPAVRLRFMFGNLG